MLSRWGAYNSWSYLLLTVLLSLHFLLMAGLGFTLDWWPQWLTSVEIANGTPMYEQGEKIYQGQLIIFPSHLPVFFYLLAGFIEIVGPVELLGKVFMFGLLILCFVSVDAVIKPSSSKEFVYLQVLFFLNPISLTLSTFLMFDMLPVAFMFLSIAFFERKRYVLSGWVAGLGVMTKVFPGAVLIPMLVLLYREKQVRSMIALFASSATTILSIFLYFILTAGSDFLNKSILFQAGRQPESQTFIQYFPFLYNSTIGSVVYRGLIIIAALFVAFYVVRKTPNRRMALIYSSIALILGFILALNSLFYQYGWWIFTLGFVIQFHHLNNQVPWRNERFVNVVVINLLFYTAGMLWFVGDRQPFDLQLMNSVLYHSGVVLTYISLGWFVAILISFWKHESTPPDDRGEEP